MVLNQKSANTRIFAEQCCLINSRQKTALMKVLINTPLKLYSLHLLSKRSGLDAEILVEVLQQLQQEGVEIFTRRADEYYYDPSEIPLHPDVIAATLQTQWWGKQIVYGERVSSTIDIAKAVLQAGNHHGALIIADVQKQGRGRQGSKWVSPPGKDLLLTFLVQEGEWRPSPSMLSLSITTAMARVLDTAYCLPVQIKWPNDLMINDKKVGGVLAEIDNESKTFLLSLGLNVFSGPSDWPNELRTQTTSLISELENGYGNHSMKQSLYPPTELSRLELLAQFGTTWEALWQQMMNDRGETVRGYWRRYSSTLRKNVRLKYQGKTYTGFARDVDEFGRLQFIADDGTQMTLLSEEVQEVRVLE